MLIYKSAAFLALLPGLTFAANVLVTTGQYDNYRTGSNLSETELSAKKLSSANFGNIGSFAVDGQVYAQPLYMSKQKSASGKGAPVNVLYVATMHNSVYAFDADSPGSQPIWKVTLAPSVESGRAGVCPETYYTSPELGILSTPVIDAASGILYAVYATPTGDSTYGHYLAALDIRTGEPRAGSPVQISASVAGDGMESQGGMVPLTGKTYIQRPALTLANGTVFTAFGSCGPDPYPYHGWVIGYKASDVKVQTSVYDSTPNGFAGAFWQSGRGLVADHLGNIYGSTGNGTNSPTDASESVVKLDPAGKLAGVFTDPNFARLNETDLDLSSSGPLYTGSKGLIVAGGKEGMLHVLNPGAIGTDAALVQSFHATPECIEFTERGCFQLHSLAFWDSATNPLLYVWGKDDVLRAYRFANGKFNTTPDAIGTVTSGFPGGTLALSANGGNAGSGIVWAVTIDGTLHAFEAANVAHEIYNSNQNPARDTLGTPVRFATPTVADGKVFVSTRDQRIRVYGVVGK